MNNSMSSVFYGNDEVRTTTISKEIWWSVVDVCRVIGVKNSRNVYKKLDEDERDTVHFLDSVGRRKEIQMCNEFGLYHILLTSHSEKAKSFRRWVTHDVLPRIRKYGYYKLTVAEQKQNVLNGIMDTLGETVLDKKYYKMSLSDLERESEFLKKQKETEKEHEKIKEKYPYTYGDIIAASNSQLRWLRDIMITRKVEKQKKYCCVLPSGDRYFSEEFKNKIQRYMSDPCEKWED